MLDDRPKSRVGNDGLHDRRLPKGDDARVGVDAVTDEDHALCDPAGDDAHDRERLSVTA